MICRGPAFSPSYDLAFPPTPNPPPVKLDRRHTGRLRNIDILLMGGGEAGGVRAESYDGDKAWSSINHLILSGEQGPCSGKSLKTQAISRWSHFGHLWVRRKNRR
jgi:hypothetical protein